MSKETSLKGLRFVGTDTSVDLEIEDGRIAKVNPSDDFSNTWVIPGLWDRHTHFTQWSYTLGRLDLIEARSAEEALDMLREHLDARRAKGTLNPRTNTWSACGSDTPCGLMTRSRRWLPSTPSREISRSPCPAPTCTASG